MACVFKQSTVGESDTDAAAHSVTAGVSDPKTRRDRDHA